MAGVSVESGGGGRKSVDQNVNMVPMIDLLISVIAFLLMTAVWVQTGALQAAQPNSAPTPDSTPPQTPEEHLNITVNPQGLRVGANAADSTDIPAGPQKIEQLRTKLHERHVANAQERVVFITPDSAVTYNDIVEVMDTVYDVWGEGRGPGQNIRDMVTIQFR